MHWWNEIVSVDSWTNNSNLIINSVFYYCFLTCSHGMSSYSTHQQVTWLWRLLDCFWFVNALPICLCTILKFLGRLFFFFFSSMNTSCLDSQFPKMWKARHTFCVPKRMALLCIRASGIETVFMPIDPDSPFCKKVIYKAWKSVCTMYRIMLTSGFIVKICDFKRGHSPVGSQ